MTERSPETQAQLDAAELLLDLCLAEVAAAPAELVALTALHLAFRRIAGLHGLKGHAAGHEPVEIIGGVTSVAAIFAGENLAHFSMEVRVKLAPKIVDLLVEASGGRATVVGLGAPAPAPGKASLH